MLIPTNCLPTSKTSSASSNSALSHKLEIYSTLASTFLRASFTVQLTLSLSSFQILLTSLQTLLIFLYFCSKSHKVSLSQALISSKKKKIGYPIFFPKTLVDTPASPLNSLKFSFSLIYLPFLHFLIWSPFQLCLILKLYPIALPISLQNIPLHLSHSDCIFRKCPPLLIGELPLSNDHSWENTWPSKNLPSGKTNRCKKISLK